VRSRNESEKEETEEEKRTRRGDAQKWNRFHPHTQENDHRTRYSYTRVVRPDDTNSSNDR
jgi:hypothetical protein